MNPISSEHNQRGEQLEDSVLDLKNVPVLTPEQERKLWRKIDLRIVPILSLMYLLAFLDRSNIGNAKLEGLVTQLDLTGNRFNITLVRNVWFDPYCLLECPANLVLKVFRPSRQVFVLTFEKPIARTLMAFVKTYPQLVGVRICLGIAEAGLFPGVVYYLTLWYPRHMLQYRIGLFFGAATVAGAFSGLLAFGIGYMGGMEGLEAWSWIFMLEGLATIVVAIIAFFVLVDFPDTAKFLTPEERAFVVWRKVKYDNSSVGEEERFASRHVWAAFRDWQVWLHIPIYVSIVGPLYGITLFLPFGYNTPVSQLLTVPPYVAATLTLLVFAYYSDKLKIRSPFILAGLTMCLIGFSMNISTAPIGVKYFGTFLIVMGSYAAYPGIISWLGNNLSGQYKRSVGMPLQMCIGNFSGAVAAVIYRSQDSPRFVLGHALELMFVGIGFIFLPIVAFIYKRINAQRDATERLATERGEKIQYSEQELRELGDRAPDFRYTL
ncbi:MFS general substrate transporter [Suillus subalutaceus]|uniref:MFS general substrate transporter n=1 Tax=Suillus subalutaceus TaxID=48586 RepID=UPI001B862450|nr:MFS general substrate transporter [Suillus subalutaceus]KAG1850813.1 MFS general substrate transporter [Suillus subalutaceus]